MRKLKLHLRASAYCLLVCALLTFLAWLIILTHGVIILLFPIIFIYILALDYATHW